VSRGTSIGRVPIERALLEGSVALSASASFSKPSCLDTNRIESGSGELRPEVVESDSIPKLGLP
jgi:hypothetical protein